MKRPYFRRSTEEERNGSRETGKGSEKWWGSTWQKPKWYSLARGTIRTCSNSYGSSATGDCFQPTSNSGGRARGSSFEYP